MKVLTPETPVKAAGFSRAFPLTTVRSRYGQEEHDRAVANGHETAFCINPGSTLLGDREESKRRNAKAAADFAAAVTVEHGELVFDRGRTLTGLCSWSKLL